MRIRLCGGLALLCAVLVAGGCGEDNPVDAGPGEMDLASFTQVLNTTGPVGPPLPAKVNVQFGVYSDPPDTSSDFPIPMIFGDYTFSQAGQSIRRTVAEPDVATTAARLVDGIDEGIYHQVHFDGGGGGVGTGWNESQGLTYAPGLARSGPDLAGYVVTSIAVKITELSVVQEDDGRWTSHVTAVGTIRGRKA